MSRTTGVFLSALLLAAGAAAADGGTIKGYMFGDYYYVASADAGDARYPEKQNAFQFRRVYFTYDRGLSESFSMRYRLEANDAGFGSGSKMTPYLKHAYLKWRGAAAGADLYLGLSGTPTFGVSEEVWGYRSIEKTVLDLNGIGSSADLGVAAMGRAGKLAYHLMLGNGPGQSPERDNGKKLYASLDFLPAQGTHVEAYADYNMQPGGRNQVTFKGFLGLQRDRYRAGLEPFVRINQKAAAGDDQTLSGVSAFGALKLADTLRGFGRVDVLNDDAGDTTDLLVIAGVDHTPVENIHLMPNLYIDMPDGPDPNVQARLTVYYTF
ncbi:MAG: hypothetical protein ABIL09_00985 [Gemmatimonadota bacterium]